MEFLGVDFRTIILAIVSVTNFILASLIYLRSKLKSSIFFVLTITGVGIWAIGINFYIQPGVNALTLFWSDMNYMIAAIFSVAFYFFGYYFGTEDKKLDKRQAWIVIGSMIVLIFLILSPGIPRSVITDVTEIAPYAKAQEFGWAFWYYTVFVFAYFFGGLVWLTKKYFTASGNVKNQLKFIVTGTGISIVLGLLTNLVLPAFGVQGNDWMGPVGTLIFVSFIAYAIIRHKLWDFKIVALQFFIALMVVILLLQIFVAEGPVETALKTAIFLVVSGFSFYLVRGLLKEVDLREEMEQLAIKLQTANKRLEQIDIEKSDFVSITSHQLRTPLTVIKGYASMLLEGAFGKIDNKKQTNAIDQIFQGSQRLVLVIQEFTNISRIEKGEMKYVFDKTNVRNVVSASIEYFRDTLKEQKFDVILNASLGGNYIIEGDREKLEQVYSNILDNAIKYTPAGGTIKIDIENDTQDKVIRTSITDTGMGIQPEMMSRLFEKFSRTQGSFRLHTEGRGLGLYVAKQIVEAHGGKIWAESTGRGKGTRFIVEYPNPEYVQKRKEIKDFLEDI
ncbi:hypothetical protein CL654_02435 [bacterium]|nr:hypothetical protein [bacterium]|tara:strand:- start:3917 stop:5599 length:1683 start_codon:yes stop_codon:yes gene_type:complete